MRGLLVVLLAVAVLGCTARGNGDSQTACRTATEALAEFERMREFGQYDQFDTVVAKVTQARTEPGAGPIATHLDEIAAFLDATVTDDGELAPPPNDEIVAMLNRLDRAQAEILAECAEIGVSTNSSAESSIKSRNDDADDRGCMNREPFPWDYSEVPRGEGRVAWRIKAFLATDAVEFYDDGICITLTSVRRRDGESVAFIGIRSGSHPELAAELEAAIGGDTRVILRDGVVVGQL
jgi:hypothetical protein